MLLTEPVESAAMTVVPLHRDNDLNDLAPSWDALAGDVPFRAWTWAECWWRHYREASSQLFLLSVVDATGETLGIAPWYLERSRGRGRTLRFLGSGEVCSDYLTILTRPETQQAVAVHIADWLAGEGAGHWDLLNLSGVQAEDPAIAALTDRLAQHGHRVSYKPDESCWCSELAGDWNSFLAGLSKSRRERTRALLRRAVDTGRAVVHRVTSGEELERAYEVLIDLHQKRRRSLSQPGCFASRRFTEFHREVAAHLLEAGQLRMHWIELDGRPAAAEYSLTGGDTVYYYQGGLEPELSEERPGWLSFATSLKLAIEEGYTHYDFLRGDESYKASWKASARPLVQVRVAGAQRSARVRFAALRACEEVKHWARQKLARNKS